MRRALAPLLFAEEQLEAERARRDAVEPAEPSAAVKRKKASGRSQEGLPLHSWRGLLDALATRCRNPCRVAGSAPGATFEQLTAVTPLQQRAFELLGL